MGKKIVHITFSDKVGGAAVAAYRLHKLMLENGLDSKMVVFENLRKEDRITTVYKEGFDSLVKKFKVYIFGIKSFTLNKKFGHYSSFNLGGNIKNNQIINEADVIYLHWVNYGLINTKDIEYLLKKGKKVLWMMHDMFPITGGCHHSFGCEGYSDKCKNCHFFNNSNKQSKQLYTKSKLRQYDNMHWIAPSRWLYEKALSSVAVNSARLHCIPNALSNGFFKLDKDFSKKALGLQEDYKYILYGANNLVNNPYKGYELFLKVIDILSRKVSEEKIENTKIILFGATENKQLSDNINIPVVFMGDVSDEYTMNLLYNASDLLLMTSVAENAPLVIQECKPSGTPIVAFNVGGIPEMINNKDDGFVFDINDLDGMALKAIELLLSNKSGNNLLDSNFNDNVITEHLKLVDE
jgi:glycosyltransferase involved in cell wall biosynthesis